jgi:hypothetical protein
MKNYIMHYDDEPDNAALENNHYLFSVLKEAQWSLFKV